MLFSLILLAFTVLVAIYDRRHREIPNWVTWPLILVGVVAHFPGSLTVSAATLLLLSAGLSSSGQRFGHGDIKLWLALLWSLPKDLADTASILVFLVLFTTSALQILLRRPPRSHPSEEQAQPAAWRTVPFMVLILIVDWVQVHYA